MMHVFLDADVILDVLSKREPHFPESAEVLSLAENGSIKGATTGLVFANLYYILRKLRSRDVALQSLRKLRLVLDVLPVASKHIDQALNADFNDFEDGVQAYAALDSQIDFLITRNVRDYKNSLIPAITPAEFLAALPFPE